MIVRQSHVSALEDHSMPFIPEEKVTEQHGKCSDCTENNLLKQRGFWKALLCRAMLIWIERGVRV